MKKILKNNFLDKNFLNEKIDYSNALKFFENIKNLDYKIMMDNIVLFKTHKRKLFFKEYINYYVLNLEKYDEKIISKLLAIIDDKYEKKYGMDDGSSDDLTRYNNFLLLFIKTWDKNAETFINTEKYSEVPINLYELNNISEMYLIYDNKIYSQK